jgi:hypothetical protein
MHPYRADESQETLRFLHPSVDGLTPLSGTYELFLDNPYGPRSSFQAIISYAIMKSDDWDEIQNGLGNIYVGLAHRFSEEGPTVTSLAYGVYLPTLGTGDPIPYMTQTHFQNPCRYTEEVGLTASYRYHHVIAQGLTYGVEIGPHLLFFRNDSPDIIAHYGFSGGFQRGKTTVLGEFYGIMWLDDELRELGDYFWNHSITVGAELRAGSFHPGVFYQAPLEEGLRDRLTGVLGISCAYTID